VDMAARVDGVFGARMMGGGFGGCTLNLVAPDAVDDFRAHIFAEYGRQWNVEPGVFETGLGGGTEVL
jgi:galactokinase